MKKFILLIFLLVAIILPSHGQPIAQFKQNGIKIQVIEFKELNDELHVTYSIDMNARAVARYQGINIILGVETPTDLLLLPSFTVLGNNKRNVLVRYYNNHRLETPAFDIEWLSDHSFIYRVTVPYQMWMDEAQLSVRQEVQGYRANTVFTHYLLGARVELESREPYQVQVQPTMLTPERVEKIIERRGQAYLDFEVGRSVILPNFRRNPEELAKINAAVSEVTTNPDAQLQNLFIHGYASPEGSWESNNRLAMARSIALKDYLRNRFSLPKSVFTVNSTAEDWAGFRDAVEQDLTLPQRDRVLQIIDNPSLTYDQKEAQLRTLGQTWTIILRDMFPPLRRVEYQINYSVHDFGVQDAVGMLDRNPALLSHLEMYQAAETFGRESDRFYNVLTDIVLRHFPDDEIAHLNAAALFIQRGETATAKRHLDRAGNSHAALNNRGIIALMEGNLETAESYFTRAQQAGNTQAAHNRHEVSLKREDNRRMERFR